MAAPERSDLQWRDDASTRCYDYRVITVGPDTGIEKTAKRLIEKRISAVLVADREVDISEPAIVYMLCGR